MMWGIGSDIRRRASRGLTLIELLISVAILAGAVVLIMQAMVRNAYGLAVTDRRMRVYAFCSSKMADLALQFPLPMSLESHGEFWHAADRFQWRVTTAAFPEDPQAELVTLTVEWQQGSTPYTSSVTALRSIPKALTES